MKKRIKSQNKLISRDFFKLLDDQDVPLAIQMSAKGVLQAESAIYKAEIDSAAGNF